MSDSFVIVVDDEPAVRELLRSQLEFLGYRTHATSDPDDALAVVTGDDAPSLAVLDIEMPGISGVDLLKRIKIANDDVQVVMVSGRHDLSTVRECLQAGAYDYLAKPFELEDLANTAKRALERRRLMRQNRAYQQNLERMVHDQTEETRRTRDLALFTLAKLAESRDSETGLHLERIAAYSQALVEALHEHVATQPLDDSWAAWLVTAAPLHDIGKVAIPDEILRKAGPLDADETRIMRTHTTIGGDTLRSVIDRYSSGKTVLHMAMEIAYSHHERWDGGGYPCGLAGADIPLASRVVALADAYDAITSERPYKPAESHGEAVRRILIDRGSHFDPVVVDAFEASMGRFAEIQQQMADQQQPRSAIADALGMPSGREPR